MKKICKQLLFLILMFMLSRLSAQSSILGTGGETTGSGGRASYSVGQIAVQTNSDGAISISEGVQQPYEISVVGVDTPPQHKTQCICLS